jgi:hypothetical protein
LHGGIIEPITIAHNRQRIARKRRGGENIQRIETARHSLSCRASK